MSLLLTPEGLRRIQTELSHVERIELTAAVKTVKELRDYGYIAKDAEMKEPLNQRKFWKDRVDTLKDMINTATIITT